MLHDNIKSKEREQSAQLLMMIHTSLVCQNSKVSCAPQVIRSFELFSIAEKQWGFNKIACIYF